MRRLGSAIQFGETLAGQSLVEGTVPGRGRLAVEVQRGFNISLKPATFGQVIVNVRHVDRGGFEFETGSLQRLGEGGVAKGVGGATEGGEDHSLGEHVVEDRPASLIGRPDHADAG